MQQQVNISRWPGDKKKRLWKYLDEPTKELIQDELTQSLIKTFGGEICLERSVIEAARDRKDATKTN